MSATDLPLKLLARQHIIDIAGWLLGKDVVTAEELNVELTTQAPRVDLVFRLALADGRTCLFHLEFQGRRSRPAMPHRQLNHLSRLALQHDSLSILESFVLYVEKYAGNEDDGSYQVERLDGSPAISWFYTPVHLWREPAEALLAIDKPGIIPLIGLMRIQQPEVTLPEVVKRLQAESDIVKRRNLFNALLALMEDEEHLAMLEKLVESDEILLDTPFLRRVRNEVSVNYILETVAVRLNPPVQVYRDFEKKLAMVNDTETLRQIFTVALTADTVETFMSALDHALDQG
ncbi:MAG TPA: hypothetical protein VF177_00475 [Anaerolineae bacterium]